MNRDDNARESSPNSHFRSRSVWLYPIGSALIGLVSGIAFLWDTLNIKPIWVLTGPPTIVVNILWRLTGTMIAHGGIFAHAVVIVAFIAYYFMLLLPSYLIRSARYADSPPPTRLYVLQFAALSIHALLTVAIFFLARA